MADITQSKEDKVLIVDDDPSVRDFLERFLKKKEFKHIRSAGTGEEAVKTVETEDVKLVLLDVRLPGMSGLEVLHKIKEINNKIGVIMITGFPEEDIAKQAIKEGAYDYIIKPFDLAYLELSMLTKIVLM